MGVLGKASFLGKCRMGLEITDTYMRKGTMLEETYNVLEATVQNRNFGWYLGFIHLKKLFRNLAECLLVVVKDTILSGPFKNL